jgi:hypothetical protein
MPIACRAKERQESGQAHVFYNPNLDSMPGKGNRETDHSKCPFQHRNMYVERKTDLDTTSRGHALSGLHNTTTCIPPTNNAQC